MFHVIKLYVAGVTETPETRTVYGAVSGQIPPGNAPASTTGIILLYG
jgi:hypothetical protein